MISMAASAPAGPTEHDATPAVPFYGSVRLEFALLPAPSAMPRHRAALLLATASELVRLANEDCRRRWFPPPPRCRKFPTKRPLTCVRANIVDGACCVASAVPQEEPASSAIAAPIATATHPVTLRLGLPVRTWVIESPRGRGVAPMAFACSERRVRLKSLRR